MLSKQDIEEVIQIGIRAAESCSTRASYDGRDDDEDYWDKQVKTLRAKQLLSNSLAGGSVPESAGTAGIPSPGTSANSDGLLRALDQAVAFSWLKLTKDGDIEGAGNWDDADDYPDLADYLRTRSETKQAEPSEPLPTTTNQEKIPASQDPEGKEK